LQLEINQKLEIGEIIAKNLAIDNEGLEELSKIAGKLNKDEIYPLFKSPYIKPLTRKIQRRMTKKVKHL